MRIYCEADYDAMSRRASILQLHNDVVLVGDEKALSRLIASGMKI